MNDDGSSGRSKVRLLMTGFLALGLLLSFGGVGAAVSSSTGGDVVGDFVVTSIDNPTTAGDEITKCGDDLEGGGGGGGFDGGC